MLGLSLREINEVQHAEAFVPTDTHFSKLEAQEPDFHYNTIVEIIHKGSYPELYKTESDLKDWRDYYSSYLQSYLEKDVKDLINAEKYERIFEVYTRNSGSFWRTVEYSTTWRDLW